MRSTITRHRPQSSVRRAINAARRDLGSADDGHRASGARTPARRAFEQRRAVRRDTALNRSPSTLNGRRRIVEYNERNEVVSIRYLSSDERNKRPTRRSAEPRRIVRSIDETRRSDLPRSTMSRRSRLGRHDGRSVSDRRSLPESFSARRRSSVGRRFISESARSVNNRPSSRDRELTNLIREVKKIAGVHPSR